MKSSSVVQLDSYRERKESRLRRARALYGHDPGKRQILLHLSRAVELSGGDRGAVLWLEEYGPKLVHAYTLLDLASDRPRRRFPPSVLEGAWNTGVPGFLDVPDVQGQLNGKGEGVRSLAVVALGSDGVHSWFLLVDSLTPRGKLAPEVAGELMFLAGECASIVLHRDLDESWEGEDRVQEEAALSYDPGPAFAGWPVLRDLEGREESQELNRRVGTRFLVARLVRRVVEDDLMVDPDSLEYQVNGVRREMEASEIQGPERELWDRVVSAAAVLDQDELLSAVLGLGVSVETQGHLSGARELHGLAHELAVAGGSAPGAIDSARFLGRVGRKLAEWEEATRWYRVAMAVAEEFGDVRGLARVLDGLANTYRDRGNLPRARELLGQVLELGEVEGDSYARAIGHHDLMTVEKLAGDLEAAVLHGWKATRSYDSREGRLEALFDLAGVLREGGELQAARDAYSVVVAQARFQEFRLLSLDALAHIAALEGDAQRYDDLRRTIDGEGLEGTSPVVRSQILYFRGLSELALGRTRSGKKDLQAALRFAETHGLNKLIFDAEEALRQVESSSTPPVSHEPRDPVSPGMAVEEVRQGLREMREGLAGAGLP
jgi:tetratricopeptide (TPR) repeat protein